MNAFLKDLVHDLREKRLWPVAAVLLLAIVAVPAVLLRSPSADEGAAAVPVPPAGAAGQSPAAAIAAADEEAGPASSLESFDEKDPFEPRGSAVPKAPDAGAGAPAAPTPPPADSSSGASAENPQIPDGPASGGNAAPPASGGAPAGAPAPAQEPASREPVLYTYEVDVRFGRRGSERTRRGVARMEPLPDSKRPLLVFLGTSASGRSAVFLVDQSLEQRGSGICRPSRGNCSLLYLRDDGDHDLHFFTDTEGRSYALRLVDIDLVRVDEAAEKKEKAAADARRTDTESDDHRAAWPFDVAPFADLAR